MTNPDHTRIYVNGDTKELSIYKIGYIIDKDPKIAKNNKKEYEEYNKKIAQELIEKGFNRFTINGAILAGFTGNDDD
jgi:predicted nucleotidyltransferase